MIQKTVTIAANRHLSGACWKMTLAAGPEIISAARPGQFVMVRANGGLKPFLPRPFSIHRINKESGELELLYKVVGDGTRQLSGLASGNPLNMVGPLGQGFRLHPPVRDIALVAGGIGVAPLVFLAETLAAEPGGPVRARAFIGGATGEDVLCRNEFEKLNMEVHAATDDGSAGFRGFVTELFEKNIETKPPEMVFACGPPAMLRAVAGITTGRNIPCQVSIETLMACGIGACLGCAVKSPADTNSYKHVCRDGPVFFSSEIDFDSLVHNIDPGHRTTHRPKR